MKIKNKAQMKIQEMAFVLLAVVFLFGLVFLFFARFQYSQLQERATQIRETRTTTMLETIASLPELKCSSSSIESFCVDEDKAKAFNESFNLRNTYKKIWESADISKIMIEKVYPSSSSYNIYKRSTTKSTTTQATYISLCKESPDGFKCDIAKIKITTIVPT